MNALFDKLQYKIISAQQIDKNTVVVKTEITAVNMKTVLGQWVREVLQVSLSEVTKPQSEKMSEDQKQKVYEDKFVEIANRESSQSVTNTIDITVEKAQNVWTVKSDDALVNAMFGGLKDAIDEMNKSFGKTD